jgi:rhodanese-related sulfurtransferase
MRAAAALAIVVAALALAAPARADHARYGPVLTIDAESARTLLERGGVATIDLRSERDFRAGRLPGAHSLPLPTLASHLEALPAADVLILYGDGPADRVLAAYHVIRPRRAGAVYVLEGGFDAWRRMGYPLER